MSAEDWIILRLVFPAPQASRWSTATDDQLRAIQYLIRKHGHDRVFECTDQLWEERKANANM